jgi:hypothetical protein
MISDMGTGKFSSFGSVALAAALGLAVAFAAGACGSNSDNGFNDNTTDDGGVANETGNSLGGGEGGIDKPVTSLTVDPPTASLLSDNGAAVTQQFKAIAHFSDGTSANVASGVTWTASNPQVGGIGGGLFTATGSVGGAVLVTATYKAKKGTADLNVKLHVTDNPNNVDAATMAALKGASTKDGTIQWAYPYDGTVFPRGLNAPLLQWNNGLAADVYYVHVKSAGFELDSFTTVPPPSRYAFTGTNWQKFVDSSSGAATLEVSRFSAGVATKVTTLSWKIAPASMRGTIYYWANAQGRVMRIKPGATAPDDFSAGTFGALPASSCTMTCHTVSADGSTLVSGGDTLGGSYDLLNNKPIYNTGGNAGDATKRKWSNAALSPNGKYIVENGNTAVPGPPGAEDGMYNTADGTRVAGSGLDGLRLGSPSFSADGTKLAYTALAGATTGSLNVFDFDLKNAKVGANTQLVAQGGGQAIQWPSVSPDAKWVVYHRGALDTRGGQGDLFLASAVTPNQEIRLSKVDGDGYPFAAGNRDLAYNYEPTFAPVPSGGYFWVVFTSRRTYGNTSVGAPAATKQLWVAAIDLNPTPGVDPSHPAFLLPGQDTAQINMRGFWALDPCKGDGKGCGSGTECCGGFCDGSGPDGGLVCASKGVCGQDGDHCDVAADCCNAASGTTCINHTCAQSGPK